MAASLRTKVNFSENYKQTPVMTRPLRRTPNGNPVFSGPPGFVARQDHYVTFSPSPFPVPPIHLMLRPTIVFKTIVCTAKSKEWAKSKWKSGILISFKKMYLSSTKKIGIFVMFFPPTPQNIRT